MADLKRNHPGRTIELSGGIMTDSPAILRDVEDLENLLPPMGGGKGLEPRDGVEHILTLSTADTEGGVIFEVKLDDVARTKLIVVMDAATGVIEYITDHTDQEGRKSIAPLGGGTLPITPAPDPVIYVNTLYFQNATLAAAAGTILTVTVLGTYLGGTAIVNVDLITAENGVDVVEATWSVTANILVSDTFNITIPVGARVGRTFDVYLNNPVAADTYLKNPTRCRVTIAEPIYAMVTGSIDFTAINRAALTFYKANTGSYYTHMINTVNLPGIGSDSYHRLSQGIIAFYRSNVSNHYVWLYRISDIVATGPALANGFTTWGEAPATAVWQVLTFPKVGTGEDTIIIPVSESKALFVVNHTVSVIDLLTGTVSSTYIIAAPVGDYQGRMVYKALSRYTADGRIAMIRIYYVSAQSDNVSFLTLLNPATQAVEHIQLDAAGVGAPVNEPFYNCHDFTITSSNVMVGFNTSSGTIGRYDIANAIRLPDVAFQVDAVINITSFGSDIFIRKNASTIVRVNSALEVVTTYTITGAAAQDKQQPVVYGDNLYLFGRVSAAGIGNIVSWNIATGAVVSNEPFAEFYNAQTADDGVTYPYMFNQYYAPDPFLTKRIEMTGA